VKLATPRWRMSFVLTALVLLAGLVAPAAGAAVKSQILFLTQPGDTEVNATIRGVDFDSPTAAFVTVQLFDGMGRPLADKTVSFKLVTDDGASAQGLHVIPQLTNASGVATFGEGTLSISVLNEPKFSPYQLIPVTVKGTPITGLPSNPFNIWEDGDSCGGGDDPCTAELRGDTSKGGVDTYTSPRAGTLGASELPASAYASFPPPGACEGQRVIFARSAFVNVSTESTTTPGPVFLTSHITRQDFRDAGANFGQAHVEWCIGLETAEAWGETPNRGWDGDGDGDFDLYVAFAPPCPNLNPSLSAPCITDQRSDGAGGSITEGFIPGGDPVRRT
jgi:hypothetical protein